MSQHSIRVVNVHIENFHRIHKHVPEESSQAARLAFARFAAKFERPTTDTGSVRRSAAWDRWISFDEALCPSRVLGPFWAKARLLVHEILSDFRMGNLTFTNGSSFEPLGDRVSLACKLTEAWTITSDCFDIFAGYSYHCRAIKHAVKKRFKGYCTKHSYSERRLNHILWNRFKDSSDPAYQIYKFKLFCCVKFVGGNRWSTVPKNNLKDRSICLEPLCNMLVQRAIGLGIRKCLKDKLGIDLDNLAEKHRYRISDSNVATIDLSDCSDAISVKLITYLLPKRVLFKVLASRSEMTLGPDDNFYVVNKVSSMGNGFTFDLMSLVLTALTRSLDATATVFGDDIICQNQHACAVVDNLRIAGFVVNLDKTLINSSYRESCGAHFIDGYGYVTSFDQRWLQTEHDVIVTCNKVAILSNIYGEPFESLREAIWSCVPQTLLGVAVPRQTASTGRPPAYELDSFIRYGPRVNVKPNGNLLRSLRRKLKLLHKEGNISIAFGIQSVQMRARYDLRSEDWDVFFQYIHNGRVSRKIPRLVVKSSLVARVDEEQIGFIQTLHP